MELDERVQEHSLEDRQGAFWNIYRWYNKHSRTEHIACKIISALGATPKKVVVLDGM